MKQWLALCGFSLLSASISAATVNSYSIDELMDLSLEELLNVEVSGISRKKENLFKSTSANHVITEEQIRRSGATSIAELLQRVPGFQVGRLSGNMWAINARSPAGRLSRQILVMIDGRKVYNPTINSVNWNRLDTYLPDIKQIEIILGPGGSLWGANAANGVINIVTKHSNDSQGTTGYAQAATSHLDYDAGGRYGYQTENGSGRVYIKSSKIAKGVYPEAQYQSIPGKFPELTTAHDQQTLASMGFRNDIELNNMQLLFTGDYLRADTQQVKISRFSPSEEILVDQEGGNLLSRLSLQHSENNRSTMHFYLDHMKQEHSAFSDTSTLYDLDFQNQLTWQNNSFLWGLGYRIVDHKTEHFDNTFGIALHPKDKQLNYSSGFAQLDYYLHPKLLLVTGLKFEDDPYTDLGVMPNLRLGYYPNQKNTLWLSASESISTPSRTYADSYLDMNGYENCHDFGATDHPELGCVIEIGDGSNVHASKMAVFEMGHRIQFLKSVLLDHNLFYNKYKDKNKEAIGIDYIYGYEASVNYEILNNLRSKFGLSYHKLTALEAHPNVLENNMAFSGLVTIEYDVSTNWQLDLFYRYMDKTVDTPSYQQLNLGSSYQLNSNWRVSLQLNDLLERYHTEAVADPTRANSAIERRALIKIDFSY